MKNIRKWQQGLVVFSLCLLAFNAFADNTLTRHIVNNGPQPWTMKLISGNGEKMWVHDENGNIKCTLQTNGHRCIIPAHTTYSYQLSYNGNNYSGYFQFFDHNGNQSSTGADVSSNGSYHLERRIDNYGFSYHHYWWHNGETGSVWLNSPADGDIQFVYTEANRTYNNGVDQETGKHYATINIPRAEIPNSVGGCFQTPSGESVKVGTTGTPGLTYVSLEFQNDGNLVMYGANGPFWATNTDNKGVTNMCWQYDGNLVLYTNNGAIWSTGTDDNGNNGDGGGTLAVQLDCNLVIYSKSGSVMWATNTGTAGNCTYW